MLSELISIDHMRIRSVNTTPRHCSRGFTLVEVVTAALLGSLLLAIFLTFAFRFTQVYNELQGAELKMSAEANSVLDKIEEDLGSVIFQKDDYEWLSYWDHPSDAQTLQPLMNTNVTVGNRVNDFEPEKSGILLCITRSPQLEEEEKKSGDVISVAYRLAYLDPAIPEDPSSRGSTYCLYRIPNPPDVTFDNFLAQEDLASIWQGDQSGAGTRFSVTPPYDVNCLLPEFLMLRNVVEFSIQFHCAYLPKVEQDQRRNRYARNQHYFRLPFSQSQKEVRVGGIAATNENSSSGGDFPDDLPDYAKVYPTTAIVRITLLSDEGIKIFHAAQEDKRPDIENLEHLIDEYGFSFQRTILLPSPI